MTKPATDPPPAEHKPDNPSLTGRPAASRPLSEAARRALAEAAARRAEIDRRTAAMAAEQFGRKGPEPVRYGDWEVKGRASDF